MLCDCMTLLILNLIINLRNIFKRSLEGVLEENPRELDIWMPYAGMTIPITCTLYEPLPLCAFSVSPPAPLLSFFPFYFIPSFTQRTLNTLLLSKKS